MDVSWSVILITALGFPLLLAFSAIVLMASISAAMSSYERKNYAGVFVYGSGLIFGVLLLLMPVFEHGVSGLVGLLAGVLGWWLAYKASS